MKKRVFFTALLSVILIIACTACTADKSEMVESTESTESTSKSASEQLDTNPSAPDEYALLNASYVIEGQEITLVNGKAESPAAPDSATMVTTEQGHPNIVEELIDGDHYATLVLKQTPGGSGTFYYLFAIINGVATEGYFLGDRIEIQKITIEDKKIVAIYLDRKENEPMTTEPSVEVKKTFTVKDSQLIEQK